MSDKTLHLNESMKILLCTPYLESPDVVSSGIGTWARNIMFYNREIGNEIDIVPVSFDRHTHIEEYTAGGFRRYCSGIKEVGKCVINAIRKLKTEKPDVVHICTSGSIAFIKDIILTRAAHRRGAKSIVHLHFGRVPSIVEEKGFEYKLLRKLLDIADTVVVIDGKSYQTLRGLHYQNIAYIPNPISNSFLHEAEKLKDYTTRKAKTAVFVGHVVPTKGVFELVEGCCKVPDVSLRIVGKCTEEMEKRLRSLSQERENGIWLTVVGEIPHREVIKELLQADIFIFPSYTEGFPNVILEAMVCGCAIASSNVGAIPEMLDNNGKMVGICYPPQNVDAVVHAVRVLNADEEYKSLLSAKAKEKVFSTYTMQAIWPQIKNLWKRSD